MPGKGDPPKEYSFKPGQSGNPNGRPKGTLSLVNLLREKLEDVPPGEDKRTYAELLIQRMMSIALKDGDVTMIRDLINRIDGMPKQSIDHKNDGGKFEAGEMSPAMLAITKEYEEKMKKALLD